MLFAEGEYKTSHYAISTGFMALGMMLPGMASGWIQEQIGYQHFFILGNDLLHTFIYCIAVLAFQEKIILYR